VFPIKPQSKLVGEPALPHDVVQPTPKALARTVELVGRGNHLCSHRFERICVSTIHRHLKSPASTSLA
jgi:hypothetical protein